MAWIDELPNVVMSSFPGAQQKIDDDEARQYGAFTADNVEFETGEVGTRRGFKSVWDPGVAMATFFNWRNAQINWLLYFHSGTTVRARHLSTGSEYDLLTGLSGVNGVVWADAGSRVFFALHASNGLGATQGYVWDGNFTGGVPNVEKLFQGPFTTAEITVTSAEVALLAGEIEVDAGTHRIAVIVRTKNGSDTGLSPVNASTFAFVPFGFVASGSNAYTITVTPAANWPNWALEARLAMTTTDNLEQYFLIPDPLNQAAIPTPGSSAPIVIRVAVSDTTLASAGTDVTDYKTFLRMQGGVGPFLPHWVAGGTNRMVYGTDTSDVYLNTQGAAYVSDPDLYQQITRGQHVIRLPGFKRITVGRWIGKAIYLFGPSWTYSRLDTGALPVEWPPIETIDEKIGTKFINGVAANPSRGYMWVADEAGLFIMQGNAYSVKPISYYQGDRDWKRINFGAPAGALKVVEIVDRYLVIVSAPLDGATFATHMLVWDYSEVGDALQTSHRNVKYSLWNMTVGGGAYKVGGMGVVQSSVNNHNEFWVSRAESAGKVLRQVYSPVDDDTQASFYTDDTDGIPCVYRTPPMGYLDEFVNWVGAFFRIRTNNASIIPVSVRALDNVETVTLQNMDASPLPGRGQFRLFRMQSPSASFRLTNGTIAGTWFKLSRIKAYYNSIFTHKL
jgi:hypothetical protein